MNPKTVGLIVAEEIAAADLMGPAEVFHGQQLEGVTSRKRVNPVVTE